MTTLVRPPASPSSVPPVAADMPALLQTLIGIFRPLPYAKKLHKRYGDVFTLEFANASYTMVVHPQGVQEIFTASPDLFKSGEANRQFMQASMGDNSMLLLDGKRHQRQRKLLMPPFHGERMRAYGQLMCDITEEVMHQQQVGKPFIIREATQEISLRVILRAVFGLDVGGRYDRLRQLLKALLDASGTLLGSAMTFLPVLRQDWGAWSPWGHYLRLKQRVDELIYAEIADRRENPDRAGEDILSLLMAARDEAGEAMSDVELRDELMTLLFAGHETTATALAWAFYWVHRDREILEKLRSELDSVDWQTDPFAITKLPYLNAVCSETLRIYPVAVATFARVLQAPFEVMGYRCEPGTALLPHIYLIHHREDLYPEPDRFNPDRFLERKYSAYEFLPFGGGNRRCIGYAFAQYEMKLVLATALSQMKLTPVNRRPVRPVRRGLTMSPSGGVRMVLEGWR